ncbi:hypothetical protein ADUPG1_008169 [Aduncisulcus paluster]|uniref:EGF-like domain-containing protein n=1 Tax=Aduncisulcus paluster TaxID=2918883 RepID=A0ABQ5KU32_9EUKA|nr:hypothetical protein ADUPG1_008169 [Aduncisulcus paluster]
MKLQDGKYPLQKILEEGKCFLFANVEDKGEQVLISRCDITEFVFLLNELADEIPPSESHISQVKHFFEAGETIDFLDPEFGFRFGLLKEKLLSTSPLLSSISYLHNKCAVCGSNESLSRHHVVPYCYRKHFPNSLKEKTSRDVIILCCKHHTEIEDVTEMIRAHIADLSGVPLHGFIYNKETRERGLKLKRMAHLLIGMNKKLPDKRLLQLKQFVCTEVLEAIEYGKKNAFPYNDLVNCLLSFFKRDELKKKHDAERDLSRLSPRHSEKKSMTDDIARSSQKKSEIIPRSFQDSVDFSSDASELFISECSRMIHDPSYLSPLMSELLDKIVEFDVPTLSAELFVPGEPFVSRSHGECVVEALRKAEETIFRARLEPKHEEELKEIADQVAGIDSTKQISDIIHEKLPKPFPCKDFGTLWETMDGVSDCHFPVCVSFVRYWRVYFVLKLGPKHLPPWWKVGMPACARDGAYGQSSLVKHMSLEEMELLFKDYAIMSNCTSPLYGDDCEFVEFEDEMVRASLCSELNPELGSLSGCGDIYLSDVQELEKVEISYETSLSGLEYLTSCYTLSLEWKGDIDGFDELFTPISQLPLENLSFYGLPSCDSCSQLETLTPLSDSLLYLSTKSISTNIVGQMLDILTNIAQLTMYADDYGDLSFLNPDLPLRELLLMSSGSNNLVTNITPITAYKNSLETLWLTYLEFSPPIDDLGDILEEFYSLNTLTFIEIAGITGITFPEIPIVDIIAIYNEFEFYNFSNISSSLEILQIESSSLSDEGNALLNTIPLCSNLTALDLRIPSDDISPLQGVADLVQLGEFKLEVTTSDIGVFVDFGDLLASQISSSSIRFPALTKFDFTGEIPSLSGLSTLPEGSFPLLTNLAISSMNRLSLGLVLAMDPWPLTNIQSLESISLLSNSCDLPITYGYELEGFFSISNFPNLTSVTNTISLCPCLDFFDGYSLDDHQVCVRMGSTNWNSTLYPDIDPWIFPPVSDDDEYIVGCSDIMVRVYDSVDEWKGLSGDGSVTCVDPLSFSDSSCGVSGVNQSTSWAGSGMCGFGKECMVIPDSDLYDFPQCACMNGLYGDYCDSPCPFDEDGVMCGGGDCLQISSEGDDIYQCSCHSTGYIDTVTGVCVYPDECVDCINGQCTESGSIPSVLTWNPIPFVVENVVLQQNTCVCNEGYSGPSCEVDSCGIIELESLCGGGSSECVSSGIDWECKCGTGFQGIFCETSVIVLSPWGFPLILGLFGTMILIIILLGICYCKSKKFFEKQQDNIGLIDEEEDEEEAFGVDHMSIMTSVRQYFLFFSMFLMVRI